MKRIIVAGAYDNFLKAKPWKKGAGVKMLRDHDWSSVVGRWDNFYLDGNKLMAEGMFSMNSAAGQECRALVMDRAIEGVSVGQDIIGFQYPPNENSKWRSKVTEASVFELSFTIMPAYRHDAGERDGIRTRTRTCCIC